MSELEKIKHLLSHFIEHTEEHAQEFAELAEKAQKEEGGKALAEAIKSAAQKLKEAVAILNPLV